MSRYGTAIYHSELKHHGILGMKWGVRRYQNEDGSLTEAGKRRYGSAYKFVNGQGKQDVIYSDDKLNKRGLKTKNINQESFNEYHRKKKEESDIAYENMMKKNQQTIAYGNKLLKIVDMIDQDGSIDKDPKRSRRAAITGMKAYNKAFAKKGYDILDINSKGDIDWFLYEDQTPGMATVADLANQGYNKKQINALIEASYRNQDYDNRKSGMFGLSEGYYRLNDDYIEACIKNRQK